MNNFYYLRYNKTFFIYQRSSGGGEARVTESSGTEKQSSSSETRQKTGGGEITTGAGVTEETDEVREGKTWNYILKLYWDECWMDKIVWYTLIRLGSDPNYTECSLILIIFTSQVQNTLISGSKKWAVNHNIYTMYYNLIQRWFNFNNSSSQIEREVEEQRERSKCAPEFIRVKESLKRTAITSAVEKEL